MVNGAEADPMFKWLKESMVLPSDEFVDTKGNGCADPDALVLPREKFGGSTVVLWTPVARSDVAWNFEKFLVGPDGAPVKRYSRYFDTNAIAIDIEAFGRLRDCVWCPPPHTDIEHLSVYSGGSS